MQVGRGLTITALSGLLVAASNAPAGAETRLAFSTYLGGFHDDEARRVAVDPLGTAHVVGRTKSADYYKENPLSFAGPRQTQCSLFIPLFPFQYFCPDATSYYTAIKADGSGLLRSTFFDDLNDVAVDGDGYVYLGGSMDPRLLRATRGAWRSEPWTPTKTGFVARLRPDGNFDWVTYVGGEVAAIALDGMSNVYATGRTDTGEWTTPRAYRRTPRGMDDAFILKLNSAGNRAVYATLLGGTWNDGGLRIGVDGTGAATVLGMTESTDLPLTGAGSGRQGPGRWQFLGRVSPDGSTLTYLSYYPRATLEDLAVTAGGDVWVVGVAGSSGYVGRLNTATGAVAPEMALAKSAARAVKLDSRESVYIAGWTQNRNLGTTADAFQRFIRGGVADSTDVYRNTLYSSTPDGFLLELSPTGRVISGTYLGGNNVDEAIALGVVAPGVVIVAGRTRSSDFPVSADALRGEYRRGACVAGAMGPNGPRDFHLLPWPCDEGFVTRLELNTAAPGLSLANTASMQYSAVAPGTVMSLFGVDLGPARGVSWTGSGDGVVAKTLGGTEVLFDGVAAPVLYAQSARVDVITPYGTAGKKSVEVVVNAWGRRVASRRWPVEATSPALFTMGEGVGQAAALNQDGTVNGTTNPAARGSVITLYATGAGAMRPPATDGRTTVAPYPVPERTVRVWIAGARDVTPFTIRDGYVPMEATYAGAAPGLVGGVLQINARVPQVARVGPATAVLLEIGGYGVLEATIAVK